jgi:hypothetical protein
MTRRRGGIEAPASPPGGFIERLTKGVERIRLLIVAVTGLVAVLAPIVYFGREELGLLVRPPSGPCVLVDSASFPAELSLREWEDTRISLKGRNRCPAEFGLYVTFRREFTSQPLFVVRSPHADLPECKGLSSDHLPACWSSKKPVPSVDGQWAWQVLLPPLELLPDPRVGERIRLRWAVWDYDHPSQRAIHDETAEIQLRR